MITFVMAGIIFKVAVITSSVARITFVLAEIIVKLAVIGFLMPFQGIKFLMV